MIEIMEGDITELAVDAIVNAAGPALRGGGGVDGAIHRAAGPRLLRECLRHAGCPTGEAVLTRGYDLPARVVIHAVGPIWRGGAAGEAHQLRRAYESAFRIALGEGSIESIAFPAISTGVYGYPKRAAAEIALAAMWSHQREFERIIACLHDAENAAIYREVAARAGAM